jgi:hypothetical protein
MAGIILTEEAKQKLNDLNTPACTKCFHFSACKVADVAPKFIASIWPFDPQSKEVQHPFFRAEDFARICRAYVRASSVVTS